MDTKMITRIRQVQLAKGIKPMDESDMLTMYHKNLSEPDALILFPPDLKLLLYQTTKESTRSIIYFWYFLVMHSNENKVENSKQSITDMSITFEKLLLNLFHKKEEQYKSMENGGISLDCKKEYDNATRTIGEIDVQDIKTNKIWIPFSKVQVYKDYGFSVNDDDEVVNALRFHFLVNYKKFELDLDKNIRRFIQEEDDNDEFGQNIKRNVKKTYKISSTKQRKIDEITEKLTALNVGGGDLNAEEQEKFKIQARILLEDLESEQIKARGSKLSVSEYKERAKENTRQWRKDNELKAKVLSKKYNDENKKKYHNDAKYRFKILRDKYMVLVNGHYIEKPRPETLQKFYLTPGEDTPYLTSVAALPEGVSFPSSHRRGI
jgi:hypothetical protein